MRILWSTTVRHQVMLASYARRVAHVRFTTFINPASLRGQLVLTSCVPSYKMAGATWTSNHLRNYPYLPPPRIPTLSRPPLCRRLRAPPRLSLQSAQPGLTSESAPAPTSSIGSTKSFGRLDVASASASDRMSLTHRDAERGECAGERRGMLGGGACAQVDGDGFMRGGECSFSCSSPANGGR
jgi:hypothetical protein